ncbi:flagellar protein FlaF [Halorubrum aquaticum]|uniref:Flagellar protein FlaF n=1 Tax=Halorubrum aquaticum TaxID=387340 RepID=A0A1I2ZSN8_9EURY|nr:flagellin [Halorubrum aquaticum]SFH40853.1 flagellar protein FlaF [Halorubrum aquaticum]
MGVSVSASTAIIVAGMFFAFTAFYPVAANGFDRVTEGERDVHERALERQNTAFSVDSATFNASGNDRLVVNATNEGSVGLVVSDTTLVVDNEYVDVANATTTVDGDGDTDLWLGGERLSVEVDGNSLETGVTNDSRVVLVVESGVRDATGVSA